MFQRVIGLDWNLFPGMRVYANQPEILSTNSKALGPKEQLLEVFRCGLRELKPNDYFRWLGESNAKCLSCDKRQSELIISEIRTIINLTSPSPQLPLPNARTLLLTIELDCNTIYNIINPCLLHSSLDIVPSFRRTTNQFQQPLSCTCKTSAKPTPHDLEHDLPQRSSR